MTFTKHGKFPIYNSIVKSAFSKVAQKKCWFSPERPVEFLCMEFLTHLVLSMLQLPIISIP